MLIAAIILFLWSFMGYGKSYSQNQKVKMLSANEADKSLLSSRDYFVSATTAFICATLFLTMSYFLK